VRNISETVGLNLVAGADYSFVSSNVNFDSPVYYNTYSYWEFGSSSSDIVFSTQS